MRQQTIVAWVLVHKWSSLICTAFLLMLCVTGLPLIFHEEIDDWISPPVPLAQVAPNRAAPTLDAIVAAARARRGGEVPLYVSFDDARPVAYVTTARSIDAPGTEMHLAAFDQRTGAALPSPPPGIMALVLRLHTDLLLGLGAELFLGAMGLLFAVAIVSGVVLYTPFMARLGFATVRHDRSARVKRLDRHNLLGVATLLWAIVVGVTGTINTLALPLTTLWKADQLASISAREAVPHMRAASASLDHAVAAARARVPGTRVQFVAYPGVAYSSGRHLAVYLQGATPLTKRLLTPVFVDPASGRIDLVGRLPWYMKALLLAQPLHFGDYGGLPMKLAWALLDLLTIAVLWTGLRLWLGRRVRPPRAQAMEVASAGLVSGA